MGDIKINDKITEQSYLELARTSQEKFNELDLKNRKLTNQINELKKSVVCAYALSRKIDEFLFFSLYRRMQYLILSYSPNDEQ